MISDETRSIIDRAKRIYEENRQSWEEKHRGRFVAIEPVSGDSFFADTFDASVKAARTNHPTRLSHTIWIGHDAAFHMGAMNR